MFTPSQSMNRIQDRMTERGMSLTELVERTGVERRVYKEAVAAGEFLPVEVLVKVAQVLDVTVAWLVGEASHPGQEISYRIYLTPRPVRYEEIRVERRENGEISMQVVMEDRIADFNFYPETVGRLLSEFSAALRDPLPEPDPDAPTDKKDAFEFSEQAGEAANGLDYAYTLGQTG